MGLNRLVGAVGIEPDRPSNSQCFTVGKPKLVCSHVAPSKRLVVIEIQLPPFTASIIQQAHVQQ
jgi:hypothetical protein